MILIFVQNILQRFINTQRILTLFDRALFYIVTQIHRWGIKIYVYIGSSLSRDALTFLSTETPNNCWWDAMVLSTQPEYIVFLALGLP